MMQKTLFSRRRILWILAFSIILFGLARLYYRLTDDFRIANINHEIPYHAEWNTPSLSQQEKNHLNAILQNKFLYIGKGAQSYAFVSEDQKYVLKFFKFKHLKPSLFVDLLPPIPPFEQYRDKQIKRKQKNLNSVFTGYRLAYDLHKEDSGLIYIHLNKTNDLKLRAKVKDKIGIERTIDLDPIVFVIQEKGKTTRAVVIELLNKGDLALVKHRIRQIFDLYMLEYKKGIYDRDHGVMHNTGFVGEKPIHLDVGKLTKDDRMKQPKFYREDLEKIGRKFTTWLKANYPKEYPELAQDMEEKLSEIFHEKFTF